MIKNPRRITDGDFCNFISKYVILVSSELSRRSGAGFHAAHHIPLFRQIQIAAGSLVLIGVIGSAFWHPFFWLSAFVGAGLVFAGISGFCGLGVLLSHMPWNRR